MKNAQYMLSTKAGNYHSQKWTILRSKYADNSCSIILHDFDDFILFLFIIVAWLFLTIFSMKYQVSPIKILKLSGHSVSLPEQFLRVRKLRFLPWNLRNEQSHFFTLYCAPPLRKIFKPFPKFTICRSSTPPGGISTVCSLVYSWAEVLAHVGLEKLEKKNC